MCSSLCMLIGHGMAVEAKINPNWSEQGCNLKMLLWHDRHAVHATPQDVDICDHHRLSFQRQVWEQMSAALNHGDKTNAGWKSQTGCFVHREITLMLFCTLVYLSFYDIVHQWLPRAFTNHPIRFLCLKAQTERGTRLLNDTVRVDLLTRFLSVFSFTINICEWRLAHRCDCECHSIKSKT